VLPSSVSITELVANAGNQCPTYPGPYNFDMHGAGGALQTTDDIGTTQVWSLASVVRCLSPSVPLSAVQGIAVVQSNGFPEVSPYSVLSPGDLMPGGFADPSLVPVIYTDGTNIFYDRPWRGGTDDNATDKVQANPLQIDIYEGQTITVTATSSANTVAPGTTVNFSATAPPADSAGITYSWNFDGGAQGSQTASGPTTSATFATSGVYDVVVQATNAAGGGGGAQIPITVTGGTPTTPGSNTTPVTGPTNSNGQTPGAPAGTSKTQHGGTSAKGHGKHPASGKSTHAGTPAAQTTTTPASTGTSSASAQPGSGSTSAGSVATTHHGKSTQSRHTATKTRAITPTGPSRLVSGLLISDVTTLPAGASPLVHVVPPPLGAAPARRRPISAAILPALTAALGVFLLFALGAGRELRWRRGWHLPGLGA
jgi:hypothetical protein